MTYAEMLLIQDAAYDFIPEIERAEDMLRHVWDRYFADAEQKPLDAWKAEDVGLVMRSCIDTLCGAVLTYRLRVGEDAGNVADYFDQAAEYREARELNKLIDAAQKVAREQHPGESFTERLRAAYDLPPAAAIDALRGLLKGGEA